MAKQYTPDDRLLLGLIRKLVYGESPVLFKYAPHRSLRANMMRGGELTEEFSPPNRLTPASLDRYTERVARETSRRSIRTLASAARAQVRRRGEPSVLGETTLGEARRSMRGELTEEALERMSEAQRRRMWGRLEAFALRGAMHTSGYDRVVAEGQRPLVAKEVIELSKGPLTWDQVLSEEDRKLLRRKGLPELPREGLVGRPELHQALVRGGKPRMGNLLGVKMLDVRRQLLDVWPQDPHTVKDIPPSERLLNPQASVVGQVRSEKSFTRTASVNRLLGPLHAANQNAVSLVAKNKEDLKKSRKVYSELLALKRGGRVPVDPEELRMAKLDVRLDKKNYEVGKKVVIAVRKEAHRRADLLRRISKVIKTGRFSVMGMFALTSALAAVGLLGLLSQMGGSSHAQGARTKTA